MAPAAERPMEEELTDAQADPAHGIKGDDDDEETDAHRDVAPKRQRREVSGYAMQGPPGAMEAAEAAAGALAEAAAGSVLDPMGEDTAVARLRGLPWSFGIQEVCDFLGEVGTKVQPGAVTMLHNAAGEAFVILETPAQMQEVMQANRRQVGKRYVEVFASSASEKHAACERNRTTSKEDAGYRGVLRMRGLPYTATVDEVLQFFGSPAELSSTNVHLLRRSDGRASGDAYVVFDTEDAAKQATTYDKQKLGSRWVDLFQSSKGELYSLTSVGGIMMPTNGSGAGAARGLGEGYSVIKLRGLPWNVTMDDIHTFLAPTVIQQGGIHLMNGANGRPSGLAYVELSSEEDQKAALAKDKQSIGGRYIDVFACTQTELQARLTGGFDRGGQAGAADATFVKLRGLPYSATEHQIMGFFTPLTVVAVQIALNQNGQPSGFGFVQFRTPDDAAQSLSRSNQVLGSRYVEVFRCHRSDMEQAHAHAVSLNPMLRTPMYANAMGQHSNTMQSMQSPPPPPQGRGGGGGSPSHRGESAYSAYQNALNALSQRGAAPSAYPPSGGYSNVQPHSCYPPADGGYANGSGMAAANYGAPEVAYSTATTPGSGYGQGGAGYGTVSGGYGQASEAGGYMRQPDGGAAAAASYAPTSHVPASPSGAYGAAGYSSADYYNSQYAHAQQYGYYPQ